MLKHEARLIDPSAEEVVAALTTATAGANKRCRARLLADDPVKWQKFARECAAKPEGYAMFRGGKGGVPATQVLAAWWTDSIGRKHVVLRGRRVEHKEANRLLQKDELEKRPPLWHAYPEYVCRRTIGTESLLVCACGCGAVGTPEALGWMGETCGPCFDRKEEAGAGALRANVPGVLYGDRAPLGTLACAPDGNRVAAVEGSEAVTYWDLATRTRTTMKFSSGERPIGVAFSSDGRYLIVAGIILFVVFDLATDPPTRCAHSHEQSAFALQVSALADPALALLLNWLPNRCRADIVRVPSGDPVRGIDLAVSADHMMSPPFQWVALSADGKNLAAVGERITLHTWDAPAPRWSNTEAHAPVTFSSDGSYLVTARLGVLKAFDVATGRPRGGFGAVGKRFAPTGHIATALVIDPGGKWLFVGGWDGTVHVADVRTLERVAVFEWHLGSVRGLAVSADGARLFSSGADGCVKVWPIRDLLKGI